MNKMTLPLAGLAALIATEAKGLQFGPETYTGRFDGNSYSLKINYTQEQIIIDLINNGTNFSDSLRANAFDITLPYAGTIDSIDNPFWTGNYTPIGTNGQYHFSGLDEIAPTTSIAFYINTRNAPANFETAPLVKSDYSMTIGQFAGNISGSIDVPTSVPEPSTLALVGLGTIGAAIALRRRKKE